MILSSEDDNIVNKKHLLGEILIKRNIITPDQLTQALKIQKSDNRYIGEILIDLGFMEERDVVVALVIQCNFPYIAVNKYDIDRSIIQLITEDIARKYQVIPLDRVGRVLSVVMADPLDVSVKAELQRLTECRVAPFIATKSEIAKAIDHWYKKED